MSSNRFCWQLVQKLNFPKSWNERRAETSHFIRGSTSGISRSARLCLGPHSAGRPFSYVYRDSEADAISNHQSLRLEEIAESLYSELYGLETNVKPARSRASLGRGR